VLHNHFLEFVGMHYRGQTVESKRQESRRREKEWQHEQKEKQGWKDGK